MRLRNIGLISAVLLVIGSQAFGTLVVDGDLSDWGVSVADNNASTYVFAGGIGLLSSMEEDQDDLAGDDGFLGLLRGGQNFDAELMAVAYDSVANKVFVAIVTGQRPDNGFARYAPGDLSIQKGATNYGLEIGGGAGGGSGTAITTGATGYTYTLDAIGFTTTAATADPAQTAGSIWSNVTWLDSPLVPPPAPTQFQINGGSTHVADADYVYTRDSVTSQHAIIELSFDASIIGPGQTATFRWTPVCDNDEVEVTVTLPVPEPTTAGLLILGAIPMIRRRRVA